MGTVGPPRILNIADLRRAAERRLPHVVFDYIDGGAEQELTLRRNIVKALSLGAKAVLSGRAFSYGLGAAGEPGVARAIDIVRTDIVRTLNLLGCASVSDLDRSYVSVPADWPQ